MINLDVCICTHNPCWSVFQIVLNSLACQTLSKNLYQVWIIDNVSESPITDADVKILKKAGITYTIVQECRLGNVYARQCAANITNGDLVVFVDDDNELANDYLEVVLDIALNNPLIGCFGGKLLLPSNKYIPKWCQPLLPYIAIIDKGDEVISNCVDEWGLWEPPTAGSCVRREVLDLYLKQIDENSLSKELGRKGKNQLLSGEDSLMMRGACKLNLQCSYQPRLMLNHHIDSNRLKFLYMLKLLYGYGRSYVILEYSLGRSFPYISLPESWNLITDNFSNRKFESLPHSLCLIAWDLGYIYERRRLNNINKEDSIASSRFNNIRILKRKFPDTWEFLRILAITLKLIK